MMLWGFGDLRGYILERSPVETRERSVRGALLDLIVAQGEGPDSREMREVLTRDVGDGEQLVEAACRALLRLRDDLVFNETSDESVRAAELAGYVYLHSGIERWAYELEPKHGPASTLEAPLGHLEVRFKDGTSLRFEQHDHHRLLWRNVTGAVKPEDEEETKPRTQGKAWEVFSGGDGGVVLPPSSSPGDALGPGLGQFSPVHADHHWPWRQVGRCVYCSCDARLYQGQLPKGQAEGMAILHALRAIVEGAGLMFGPTPPVKAGPVGKYVLADDPGKLVDVEPTPTYPAGDNEPHPEGGEGVSALSPEPSSGLPKPTLPSPPGENAAPAAVLPGGEPPADSPPDGGSPPEHSPPCEDFRGIPDTTATPYHEAAARRTLEAAKQEAASDIAPGIWQRLEDGPLALAPKGQWCCACLKAFEVGAYVRWHEPALLYAHVGCVDRERARVVAEAEAAVAKRQAEKAEALPEGASIALALAWAARTLKPFKARHRKAPGPTCENCLEAVAKGALVRRVNAKSSRRLHEGCVLEQLGQLTQPTESTPEPQGVAT